MELVRAKWVWDRSICFIPPHFPPPLPPLHPSTKETFPPFPIHQSMLTVEKSDDLEQLKVVVENRSDSQCCTGSQSGWTLYLEQSQSQSQSQSLHYRTSSSVFQEVEDEDDEAEEDLSMLSDASSGPPHAHDDEENYSSSCTDEGDGFLPLKTRVPEHENKRRRVEEGRRREEEYSGDSAGSTLSSISKATTSNSKKSFLTEGEHSSFSATHF
ncbi:hypothetical protein KSP39_PZI015309 [Platanthera zijinensis]|uniref:Uncharacterized protein n=1 Tax=Platanthera zijinensis TaxID=2320716 RepID=A0AAP0G1Q4_9ASPA